MITRLKHTKSIIRLIILPTTFNKLSKEKTLIKLSSPRKNLFINLIKALGSIHTNMRLLILILSMIISQTKTQTINTKKISDNKIIHTKWIVPILIKEFPLKPLQVTTIVIYVLMSFHLLRMRAFITPTNVCTIFSITELTIITFKIPTIIPKINPNHSTMETNPTQSLTLWEIEMSTKEIKVHIIKIQETKDHQLTSEEVEEEVVMWIKVKIIKRGIET